MATVMRFKLKKQYKPKLFLANTESGGQVMVEITEDEAVISTDNHIFILEWIWGDLMNIYDDVNYKPDNRETIPQDLSFLSEVLSEYSDSLGIPWEENHG